MNTANKYAVGFLVALITGLLTICWGASRHNGDFAILGGMATITAGMLVLAAIVRSR